jgi:hypothetical protein
VAAVELEKEAQRPHVVALVVCLGSSRVQEALQKKMEEYEKEIRTILHRSHSMLWTIDRKIVC